MDSKRLLLVEDDAATREILALLLDSDGWSVHSVESGEEALEALRGAGAEPEVILCDLHLPGIGGAALAAALRAAAPRAILLAMSASRPGEAGANYDATLLKPFGPAEFRAVIVSVGTQGPAGHAGVARAGGSDLPVIATETFLKIEQQMGIRARELYAFALADAGDRLRRMEGSLARGDGAVYVAEAHALKGSAGMIGATRLAALAGAAESEYSGGSQGEKVQQMHLACDEIRLMLETLFPI